jgi:hypothetical protein
VRGAWWGRHGNRSAYALVNRQVDFVTTKNKSSR